MGADGVAVAGPSGDDDEGDLTNIDFVPSINLPPRGGPSSIGGGAKLTCEGAGDVEGPAPGDCGGIGLCLVYI